MSNSMTEHSKKLRAKTAAEWTQKQLEQGTVRRVLIQFKAEDADELDAIAKELGLSRPQAIKRLCEVYRRQAVA